MQCSDPKLAKVLWTQHKHFLCTCPQLPKRSWLSCFLRFCYRLHNISWAYKSVFLSPPIYTRQAQESCRSFVAADRLSLLNMKLRWLLQTWILYISTQKCMNESQDPVKKDLIFACCIYEVALASAFFLVQFKWTMYPHYSLMHLLIFLSLLNAQGRLPVKWMAPEALFDRVYTHQSDV